MQLKKWMFVLLVIGLISMQVMAGEEAEKTTEAEKSDVTTETVMANEAGTTKSSSSSSSSSQEDDPNEK